MKKIFLTLALCCSVAFAGCKKNDAETIPQNPETPETPEVLEIPEDMEVAFPDPVFRAYVLKYFDTDGDGIISQEESEAVTEIDVLNYPNRNDSKCRSLEGIQYFPNLISLTCSSNRLTTLDVSNNTQLTNVSCSSNRLATLDVSNNTRLNKLWCSNNRLTTLDVSKNRELEELWCHTNQLTALDVSNNTQLAYLYCDSNRLATLDVSCNTRLKELSCYSNQLTTLDVSNNTQLKWLYCGSNRLTALDVSNNTQLWMLYCYNNQLTTLDISKTALGNYDYPTLFCAPMETLETLYLKKGWSIRGITEDNGRSDLYIPEQTEIVFVD